MEDEAGTHLNFALQNLGGRKKKENSGGLDTGCREAGKAKCISHLSVQFPVSGFQFSRVTRFSEFLMGVLIKGVRWMPRL